MKDSPASIKPSTLHQRQYRERMRALGLVKKDVWIRPEYAAELAGIEKAMRAPERDPALPSLPANVTLGGWTLATIHHAIALTSQARSGEIAIEVIEGAQPSLHLVLHRYGGLSVFLAVGGEQVLVEAYLWPESDVIDPAAFNTHVLSTHKLLPLSVIGLQTVAGVRSYTMFGALDPRSSLANLMFEIETLAENVIAACVAYAPYLREDALPEAAA